MIKVAWPTCSHTSLFFLGSTGSSSRIIIYTPENSHSTRRWVSILGFRPGYKLLLLFRGGRCIFVIHPTDSPIFSVPSQVLQWKLSTTKKSALMIPSSKLTYPIKEDVPFPKVGYVRFPGGYMCLITLLLRLLFLVQVDTTYRRDRLRGHLNHPKIWRSKDKFF